jgi:hypothetical protein
LVCDFFAMVKPAYLPWLWRQDTQHKDIQQNDTRHKDIQHNDTQHNCGCAAMLCHYAECCYAECRYAECRGALVTLGGIWQI